MLIFMRGRPSAYKTTALVTSIFTFALAVYLATQFQTGTADYQFVENHSWIASLGISYHLGVDGISLLLVLLTTLLSVLAILGSWNSIKDRGLAFFISLLVLETGMLGVFVSHGPLPVLRVLGDPAHPHVLHHRPVGRSAPGLRGHQVLPVHLRRLGADAGGHPGRGLVVREARRPAHLRHPRPCRRPASAARSATWAFAAFFIAFAIKVPMFPVHTWLPDAHTEAPTAGSVILAGVLLKMGVYGMIRFCIGFFPEVAVKAMVPVLILSAIAVVYGAAMSLVQPDMKRLVAYSSVSHMGFVTAGLFTFNQQGIEGSVLQMVNHGVLTGALFMMVGFFYDRTHTRLIKDYGGMARPMPVAAAFFSLFVLGSLGLPGLNGFVGEFLILVGVVPVREGLRRDRLDRDRPGRRLPAVDVPAHHVPAGEREVAAASRT